MHITVAVIVCRVEVDVMFSIFSCATLRKICILHLWQIVSVTNAFYFSKVPLVQPNYLITRVQQWALNTFVKSINMHIVITMVIIIITNNSRSNVK